MIGTGLVHTSDAFGSKVEAMKEFLRQRISCRYCSASEYYRMKRAIESKVSSLNAECGGAALIAEVTDVDAVTQGWIRIYRTRGSSMERIAHVPVYWLWPLNVSLDEEKGGDAV